MIALLAMGAYVIWHYRKEWAKVSGGISETLYEKLKENGRIRDPDALQEIGNRVCIDHCWFCTW